ncbi:MAG: DUF2442 domain-containing protein [Pseudanabaena sp.]|nr:MAG: DUF2442 domain-containing protein [Pseudanabaena sp.]
MKPPKIISAKAVGDRTLLIEFSDKAIKKYDISRLLEKEMFAALKNPSFLKNFRVEAGGYGLVWNEDIDISEYELWNNGVVCTDVDSELFTQNAIACRG